MGEVMTDRKLRVVIAGLGAAAHDLHIPACQATVGRIEIVGGCDTQAAARQRFGLADTFVDIETMLEKTRPDFVIVATPPADHLRSCLAAIEAGCHVFCEKPFAESLEDAGRVIASAQRRGVHVVVNNQFRYMNIHRAAFQAIGSPDFGKLRFVAATQTFRPTAHTERGWRGQLKRRTCLEFGIHVLDLLRYFFQGEPNWIFASMPRADEDAPDLLNSIQLEFGEGNAATVILDRLSHGPEHYLSMRLVGEHADINTAIGGKLDITLGMHTRTRSPYFHFDMVLGGEAKMQKGLRVKSLAKDPLNPMREATKALFADVVAALLNGREPPNSAEDNRKSLALVMAAYESVKIGRPVITNTRRGANKR